MFPIPQSQTDNKLYGRNVFRPPYGIKRHKTPNINYLHEHIANLSATHKQKKVAITRNLFNILYGQITCSKQ